MSPGGASPTCATGLSMIDVDMEIVAAIAQKDIPVLSQQPKAILAEGGS